MKKEQDTNLDINIDDLLKEIRKSFGEGSIMRLGDRPNVSIELTLPCILHLLVESS